MTLFGLLCLFLYLITTALFLFVPWRYFHKISVNGRVPWAVAIVLNVFLWLTNYLLLAGVGLLLGISGEGWMVFHVIFLFNGVLFFINGLVLSIA
jgi:hypothetical protein